MTYHRAQILTLKIGKIQCLQVRLTCQLSDVEQEDNDAVEAMLPQVS